MTTDNPNEPGSFYRKVTADKTVHWPSQPLNLKSAPESDLAAIIGKTGDLGIRAIAAMANVSEDELRRAVTAAESRRDDHPSTVTVHVLTSADIERLARLIYWLTTKMPWHDILGAIIDSAGVDMNSPGAEALARELVAELLRKNGADHGR